MLRPTTESSDNRFPREFRLTDPAAFRHVFKSAKRSHDRYFTLLSRDNKCGHARLGLAISVKAAGNAVNRNQIKRQVREYFRQHKTELPPIDLVVIAKHSVVRENPALIASSLDRHWRFINKQWSLSQ